MIWLANLSILLITASGIAFWIRWWHLARTDHSVTLFQDDSVRVRWGLGEVILVFVAWLMFQMAAQATLLIAWGVSQPPDLTNSQRSLIHLVSASGGLVGVGLAFVFIALKRQHRVSEFGFTLSGVRRGIWMGLCGFAMTAPIVWLTFDILRRLIEYRHDTMDLLAGSHSAWGILCAAIPAVIAAPIVEELIFRVMLQGWLQKQPMTGTATAESDGATNDVTLPRRWNPVAIVLSSILFSMMHFSQGPAPYSLFLFSLGLGYLYQRTGNAVACIVMHMALNLVGFAFMANQVLNNPG